MAAEPYQGPLRHTAVQVVGPTLIGEAASQVTEEFYQAIFNRVGPSDGHLGRPVGPIDDFQPDLLEAVFIRIGSAPLRHIHRSRIAESDGVETIRGSLPHDEVQ